VRVCERESVCVCEGLYVLVSLRVLVCVSVCVCHGVCLHICSQDCIFLVMNEVILLYKVEQRGFHQNV